MIEKLFFFVISKIDFFGLKQYAIKFFKRIVKKKNIIDENFTSFTKQKFLILEMISLY